MKELIHPELSYQIVGVLFAVHNMLGKGYQEKYYQWAVATEFRKRNIPFVREHSVPVQYDGSSIGQYLVDFLVADKVLLEIKTVDRFKPAYFRQVLGYLRETHIPLAILANFSSDRLRYRRIINFTTLQKS